MSVTAPNEITIRPPPTDKMLRRTKPSRGDLLMPVNSGAVHQAYFLHHGRRPLERVPGCRPAGQWRRSAGMLRTDDG